jgi:hypothetical protein
VTVDGALMVKDIDEVPPELETLPAPAQPVQTYRAPDGPETGELTEAETNEPPSNQPLPGTGEP